MKYDAVFFDSGGTLFKSETESPTPREMEKKRPFMLEAVLKGYGFDVKRPDLEAKLGVLETALKEEMGAKYSFYELMKSLVRELKIELADEDTAVLTAVYAGPRYKHWLFEGVPEMLKSIKEAGIYVGLIANTAWPEFAMRTAYSGAGICMYFDSMTISCDEGCEKPDARIFGIALEKARLKDGARILYVGDSIRCDIKGAKGVGWDAAFRRSGGKGSGGLADFEFEESQEAAEFICG
ncbi:MAG: HAD-IA family hydrolase [Planctomycetes bacterium]|nr:HAD-IA family hydrolase [Planctomycetota bacterium]